MYNCETNKLSYNTYLKIMYNCETNKLTNQDTMIINIRTFLMETWPKQ